MKIIQYTFVLMMAFSLVFAGQAEAKQHASEKTRARVLKEMTSHNTTHAKIKKI